ncbi:putative nucleotidyltransferase substrate binding domain-containing protein [Alteromonas sp. 1_MG-2023]|uniref:putative nucleotidyltransferase substrate binding domain-containing protein n=1 Tax=Alteromonas sp. 1_MG-2023 TaxID=3062669 RepID=UPI0026E1B516|nr:putative nucleotidyltransferase substrate binding domain-containing protein [Alteromonas sp. 1_MG-2023]MDO6568270.1 putative nucleotidyltransferase substrate binding domain-containing protein [Alteromonas sp. 1_MG-2023]
MTVVAQQVADFVTASAPFDTLDIDSLTNLLSSAELLYVTQENLNTLIGPQIGQSRRVYLIQSGQFSVSVGQESQRYVSEGDYFGFQSVLDERDYSLSVTVENPGLIYSFEAGAFKALLSHQSIAGFFHGLRHDVLQNQAITDSKSMWLYKPLNEVTEKQPISADGNTSIQQAAQLMTDNRVSSLLITQAGQLVGIVTDRDLRSRVVAAGIALSNPVSSVMTPSPAHVANNLTLFDAMALMTEKNIHHLPILDKESHEPVGMVTASDIVRHQRGSVLFIIGELSKADSLYALTRLAWQIPHYFSAHAKHAGDYDIAGKVLSQATDIMTRKLIGFFQKEHGKADMMFSWLVYGSQAREDQTMGSDQDNALLLAEPPTKAQAAYFAAMADYVCKGLGMCGIKLCSGNIMASNPELRLSLTQAVKQAQQWVNAPTKDAIMHFNIFLDVRCAAGDVGLFKSLQRQRMPLLKQSLFLAALSRHANEVSVPLSLFQKFTYEKGGKQKDTIDLKVRAVALINNIARIYALASGVTAPGTLARLSLLPDNSELSTKDAANLRDIWIFLNRLRWRHQLQNNVADNSISVSSLSSIEKHQLKASFQAIERAQKAIVMNFSGGMA